MDTASASAPGPTPGAIALLRDLPADLLHMKNRQLPLLLLVSRSDCPYCAQVRNHYLRPLAAQDRRVLVRELVSDYQTPILQSPGHSTTHAQFAQNLEVRFYPTLLFFNSKMQQIAAPLIGADKAGFYGSYLDDRIAAAKAGAAQ
jgi:hypothetical protein